MNELAARKALIVAQADLHRQLIAFERVKLQGRHDAARAFVEQNRWWLLGGAIVAGLLLARHRRELVDWAPTVIAAVQALKKLSAEKSAEGVMDEWRLDKAQNFLVERLEANRIGKTSTHDLAG
ncbi:MAG: hypothetical protein Q7S40_02680 [Opitutaceae bacterium]|nr:hypothetical protein [Opitutaceae bacterium]